MADVLLQFALKMKRLIALCIVSPLLDENVMQDIRFCIAKNVFPVQKSLWFNIGGQCPTRSDQDVPSIHYSGLVESVFYISSPSKSFLPLEN